MEKTLKQWADDFIKTREKEGVTRDSMFAIRGCLKKYLDVKSDISDDSIDDYIQHTCLLRSSTKKVYYRFLKQFQKFVRGEPRKVAEAKINFELLDHAISGSYVDDKGLLMVKYSNVPALIAWANVLKNHYSLIDFDYHATIKARREYNRKVYGDNQIILPRKERLHGEKI